MYAPGVFAPARQQRPSSLQSAETAFTAIIRELGLESGVGLYRLRRDWGKIVNEPLSLHTAPSALHEGLLTVNADTSAWLQEINYFKRELGKKLAPFGVKDLRFKLGRLPQRRVTPVKKPRELTAEDREFIDSVLAHAPNPEINEMIRSLMEHDLMNKKQTPKI